MDRKYDVITLGEILLRLSTPINGRLAQGDTFMKHLGGAELNIASEIGPAWFKHCHHLKNTNESAGSLYQESAECFQSQRELSD